MLLKQNLRNETQKIHLKYYIIGKPKSRAIQYLHNNQPFTAQLNAVFPLKQS